MPVKKVLVNFEWSYDSTERKAKSPTFELKDEQGNKLDEQSSEKILSQLLTDKQAEAAKKDPLKPQIKLSKQKSKKREDEIFHSVKVGEDTFEIGLENALMYVGPNHYRLINVAVDPWAKDEPLTPEEYKQLPSQQRAVLGAGNFGKAKQAAIDIYIKDGSLTLKNSGFTYKIIEMNLRNVEKKLVKLEQQLQQQSSPLSLEEISQIKKEINEIKKVLPKEWASCSPEQKRGFEQEHAKKLRTELEHEREMVIAMYGPDSVGDIVENNGKLYLPMKYIPGQTLEDYINHINSLPENLRPSLDQQLAITAELIKLGVYLQERGFKYHGDLAPRNIHLDLSNPKNPKAYLLDFGLARLDIEGGPKESEKGPLSILPPEFSQKTELTQNKRDVFGIAGCIFALLDPLGMEVLKRRMEAIKWTGLPALMKNYDDVISNRMPQWLQKNEKSFWEKEPYKELKEKVLDPMQRVEVETHQEAKETVGSSKRKISSLSTSSSTEDKKIRVDFEEAQKLLTDFTEKNCEAYKLHSTKEALIKEGSKYLPRKFTTKQVKKINEKELLQELHIGNDQQRSVFMKLLFWFLEKIIAFKKIVKSESVYQFEPAGGETVYDHYEAIQGRPDIPPTKEASVEVGAETNRQGAETDTLVTSQNSELDPSVSHQEAMVQHPGDPSHYGSMPELKSQSRSEYQALNVVPVSTTKNNDSDYQHMPPVQSAQQLKTAKSKADIKDSGLSQDSAKGDESHYGSIPAPQSQSSSEYQALNVAPVPKKNNDSADYQRMPPVESAQQLKTAKSNVNIKDSGLSQDSAKGDPSHYGSIPAPTPKSSSEYQALNVAPVPQPSFNLARTPAILNIHKPETPKQFYDGIWSLKNNSKDYPRPTVGIIREFISDAFENGGFTLKGAQSEQVANAKKVIANTKWSVSGEPGATKLMQDSAIVLLESYAKTVKQLRQLCQTKRESLHGEWPLHTLSQVIKIFEQNNLQEKLNDTTRLAVIGAAMEQLIKENPENAHIFSELEDFVVKGCIRINKVEDCNLTPEDRALAKNAIDIPGLELSQLLTYDEGLRAKIPKKETVIQPLDASQVEKNIQANKAFVVEEQKIYKEVKENPKEGLNILLRILDEGVKDPKDLKISHINLFVNALGTVCKTSYAPALENGNNLIETIMDRIKEHVVTLNAENPLTALRYLKSLENNLKVNLSENKIQTDLLGEIKDEKTKLLTTMEISRPKNDIKSCGTEADNDKGLTSSQQPIPPVSH